MRVGGAGYRVVSRAAHTRSRSWDRIGCMYTKPRSNSKFSLELWLGRGAPMNPYLRGLIMDWLRKEMLPKD